MNPFFFAGQFSHPVSPFFPNQISGLAAWFDASNFGSITQSGGQVFQWNDLSSNSWNLSGSLGIGPQYNTTGLNGFPALTFSGNKDSMINGNFLMSQPNTYVLIGNSYSGLSLSRAYMAFGAIGDPGSTPRQNMYLTTFSSPFAINLYAGAQLSTNNTLYQPSCLFAVFNSTSSIINLNGTGLVTGDAGTSAQNGFCLGSNFQETNETPWRGAIAELICYSGILTIGQINQIHQYSQAKWGTP